MTETTAPVRDLMTEFRGQRAMQIANIQDRKDYLDGLVKSGDARRLEDGRIKVTKGFDAGEVFDLQGQPVTGLTVNTQGDAEFYASGVRPWHPLGTFFPDGLHSASAALKAAHLDGMLIAKRPAGFLVDPEADQAEFVAAEDDMFLTVRTDTMKALGQVGQTYTPIQNLTAFQWMERLEMPFETVGSFRGGRRVFASMKLPGFLEVATRAGLERIQLYVFGVNQHDGNGGLKLGVGPYRIECHNLERMALNTAETSWTVKHTPNHGLKLEEAETSLRLVRRYAVEWTEDQNRLAATTIQKADVSAVISDVLAEIYPEKETNGLRKENKLEARVTDIMERFLIESDRTGGATAYSLERALTGHLDHAGERRPRGDQKGLSPLALEGLAALEGADDKKKVTVHRRVKALLVRK